MLELADGDVALAIERELAGLNPDFIQPHAQFALERGIRGDPVGLVPLRDLGFVGLGPAVHEALGVVDDRADAFPDGHGFHVGGGNLVIEGCRDVLDLAQGSLDHPNVVLELGNLGAGSDEVRDSRQRIRLGSRLRGWNGDGHLLSVGCKGGAEKRQQREQCDDPDPQLVPEIHLAPPIMSTSGFWA